MKKCPACNSSRYKENIVDGKPIKACEKCGFINKAEYNEKEVKGQVSLDFNSNAKLEHNNP